MKRLFILFVLVHLVMDVAIPSAGAFRFNPDESVVALPVQPFLAQDLAPAPQAEPLGLAFELPRLAPRVLIPRNLKVPGLIPLLPRRDPSSDLSPQSPTEPA